jgi:hypothetical protein
MMKINLPQKLMGFWVSPPLNVIVFFGRAFLNPNSCMTKVRVLVLCFPYFMNNSIDIEYWYIIEYWIGWITIFEFTLHVFQLGFLFFISSMEQYPIRLTWGYIGGKKRLNQLFILKLAHKEISPPILDLLGHLLLFFIESKPSKN